MQLTRWLGLCAVLGGTGVVLMGVMLGWEQADAVTGTNSDLRIMGGAVALMGVLTMIISGLERDEFTRSKGPSV